MQSESFESRPLTFPTMAEQALEEFNSATKTVSLATIAIRRGAFKEVSRSWPSITTYVFDDSTTLVVTGRGKSYKAEAQLP